MVEIKEEKEDSERKKDVDVLCFKTRTRRTVLAIRWVLWCNFVMIVHGDWLKTPRHMAEGTLLESYIKRANRETSRKTVIVSSFSHDVRKTAGELCGFEKEILRVPAVSHERNCGVVGYCTLWKFFVVCDFQILLDNQEVGNFQIEVVEPKFTVYQEIDLMHDTSLVQPWFHFNAFFGKFDAELSGKPFGKKKSVTATEPRFSHHNKNLC